MTRVLKGAGAAVGALSLLAGCTSGPSEQANVVEEPSVVACQLSDERGLLDYGVNASVAAGMSSATAIGAAGRQVESGNPADYAADLASLSSQNCDVVIGVGALAEPMQAQLQLSTDEKFVIVDGAFTNPEGKLVQPANGKSVQFDAAQGGFLAGYLAAGLTTTGKVGVLGGTDTRQTKAAMDGFVDGVAAYNAANQTQVASLGWDKASQGGTFAGSAVDATRGQSGAKSLIAEGVDVVTPIGGPFGNGALFAAADAPGASVIWFGGAGKDLPAHADLVAGSVVLDAESVIAEVLTQSANADFDPAPEVGTVENSGVVLRVDDERVKAAPRDLAAQLKDVTAKLADGSITVVSANGPYADG